MAIHYRVIERKNILPNAKNKTVAYAQAKQVGKVTTKELAEDISDRTTLHRADVRAVLDALSISTLSFLEKGLGVELGEMGNISIRLKSKSTPNKADFKASNVLGAHIRYTPSVEMKSKLKRVGLRDLELLTQEGDDTKSDPGKKPTPNEPGKPDTPSKPGGSGDHNEEVPGV